MLRRAYLLYWYSIRSAWNKIRYDLAGELTIFLCCSVLIGLFYYVFDDFLNSELARISLTARALLAQCLSIVLAMIVAVLAGQRVASELKDIDSLLAFSKLLGEDKTERTIFLTLRIPSLIFFLYVPSLFFIFKVFLSFGIVKFFVFALSMLTLTGVSVIFNLRKARETISDRKPRNTRFLASSSTQLMALVTWRLRIFFLRSRTSQFYGGLAVVLGLLNMWPYSMHSVIHFLVSFNSGVLLAWVLCFQLGIEQPSSWLEKHSGVSHSLYMMSIRFFVVIPALLLAGLVLSCFMVGRMLSGGGSLDQQTVLFGIQMFFITLAPSYIIPNILFQIDARRPWIQSAVVFLLSLFLSTAIYASILGVLILPFFDYYGKQSQENRFYRA